MVDSVKFSGAQFPQKPLLGLANVIIQPGAGGWKMNLVVLLANLVDGDEASLIIIIVYRVFKTW